MWIMAISQNYGIQVDGNCLNFKQGPPTPWQCYCTGCIPAQTWDLVDYSLLSEAQTSGIKQRSGVGNVVEEIVVDGLCIYVCLCVAWTISLCVSDSLCFPPVLSQYRGPTEPSVSGSNSKRVRKTTTGSVSARGLSTASASCICLTFPKQNIKPWD